MKKFNYQIFGAAALCIYAAGSLLGLLTIYRLSPGLSSVLDVAVLFSAVVLAQVWSIGFWRAQRTRLSMVVLAFVSIIVVANLLLLAHKLAVVAV